MPSVLSSPTLRRWSLAYEHAQDEMEGVPVVCVVYLQDATSMRLYMLSSVRLIVVQ